MNRTLPVLFACFCPSLALAEFIPLGFLPGGDFSAALAVSADGSTVVGMSRSATSGSRTEAFRWTRSGGVASLGQLPGGNVMSAAGAVSADGSVVAGIAESAAGTQAFRWTASTGMVPLGDLSGGNFNSGARGISADGRTIVGSGSTNAGFAACRWVDGAAPQLIGSGDVTGGAFNGSAQSASADGSIIYGSGVGLAGPVTFRWTAQTGLTSLSADLPGGGTFSEPFGATPDGRFVVGRSRSTASTATGFEAFRFDFDTKQLIGLGDLPGGAFVSYANAITADGSTIVGLATSSRGEEAFIWDAEHGMRLLADVLTTEFNADLTGWQLSSAWAISDDGRTIVGGGINPDGLTEAWTVTIPAPPVAAVLLAILGISRRRRCSSSVELPCSATSAPLR